VVYRFDNYSLDPELRELRFGSELVSVEPKVFDLLHYLIRNRDRVVSKDDMLSTVWSGRIVSESALTSRLTAVRHAVGDSGEEATSSLPNLRRCGSLWFPSQLHRSLPAGVLTN
jgi:DNA-binding winged helix-turn-helix (wHTH) protein